MIYWQHVWLSYPNFNPRVLPKINKLMRQILTSLSYQSRTSLKLDDEPGASPNTKKILVFLINWNDGDNRENIFCSAPCALRASHAHITRRRAHRAAIARSRWHRQREYATLSVHTRDLCRRDLWLIKKVFFFLFLFL